MTVTVKVKRRPRRVDLDILERNSRQGGEFKRPLADDFKADMKQGMRTEVFRQPQCAHDVLKRNVSIRLTLFQTIRHRARQLMERRFVRNIRADKDGLECSEGLGMYFRRGTAFVAERHFRLVHIPLQNAKQPSDQNRLCGNVCGSDEPA
jgi:hypothetical protein